MSNSTIVIHNFPLIISNHLQNHYFWNNYCGWRQHAVWFSWW